MPAVVGHENVIRGAWSREAAGPTKLFVSCWYLERKALLALQQIPQRITIPRPLPETAYAVYSQRSSVTEHEDIPFHCNVKCKRQRSANGTLPITECSIRTVFIRMSAVPHCTVGRLGLSLCSTVFAQDVSVLKGRSAFPCLCVLLWGLISLSFPAFEPFTQIGMTSETTKTKFRTKFCE